MPHNRYALAQIPIQLGLVLNKSKIQLLRIFIEVWTKLKTASPALAWGGAMMLFASLVTLGLSALDPRLFQGVSVWHKPWKFQISTVFYWWSLAWFVSSLSSGQFKTRDFHNKFPRHELHRSHITQGLMRPELVVILNPVISSLLSLIN